MKNGLFKKSMSVFLAMLMLLTCWVWVAPTQAEAIATDTTYRKADKYGTAPHSGTKSNYQWVAFYDNKNSSNNAKIYFPTAMYLDKSETLQSAGYKIILEYNYGTSTNYRLLFGGPIWGDYKDVSGKPDAYYTMTNLFSDYTIDASLQDGGTTSDVVVDKRGSGDGFNADSIRHETYVAYAGTSQGMPNEATIYLMGTPDQSYDYIGKDGKTGTFNTAGASADSYGIGQGRKNASSSWSTDPGGQRIFDDKWTQNDGSYKLNGWAEMYWTVTIYDKSTLNATINEANNIINNYSYKYTTASINSLKTALNNNKGVLTTRATTQSNINTANTNIRNAINGLVRIYTITYDTAGGTIVGSDYTTTFTKNDNLILPEATRTGYTFGGWKVTEADGTLEKGKVYGAANYGTNFDGNATLVAQWTEHKYNIAFNANGGSGSTTGINNVLYSADTKLTANAFSRTGYTFNGWNTKADGTGTAYADGATVSKLSATNGATVTLYAQWKVNKYNVTFTFANGKSVTTQYDYGTTITAPANTAAYNDEAGHHTFAWPEISAVTNNVIYTEKETIGSHTVVIDAAVPATCTTPGKTEGKHCSVCNVVLDEQETIPAAHTPGTAANCGVAQTCTVCGEVITPATGNHTWGEWTETKAPTCTEVGEEKHICSVCSASETRAKAASGHTLEKVSAKPSTCTEDGNIEHWHCSACDKNFADASGNTVLDSIVDTADGHTFKATIPEKQATCLAAGYEAYKHCSACNLFFAGNAATDATDGKDNASSFAIAKKEHSYTGDIKSDGNGKNATHSFKCVNGCNLYGAATAHTWNNGETTTNASCLTQGVKTYTCTVEKCGATYTETIPASGHTFGATTAANAATCTEAGNVAYKQCTACNLYFAENAATNANDGKSDTSSFVIAKKEHSYTGDIKSDGNGKDATHSFKCVNGCNDYGAETKHTWNNGVTTTNATCLTQGVKTYTCTVENCGATYIETIPASGHTFGATTAANAATCLAAGNNAYKQCTACNLYFAENAATNATDGKSDTSSFAIAQKEHSYTGAVISNGNGKDATHSFKCVNGCNLYGATTTHTWSVGVINPDSTCTQPGVKTFTCIAHNCGATYTEEVPLKEHALIDVEAKTPTCTEDGHNAYVYCSNCGYTTKIVDPATGHDYDRTKSESNLTRPEKNADGTWSDGYYTYTCKNNEEHKITETVARADYSEYDAAVEQLEELLKKDITNAAKAEIEKVLGENQLAENLIVTEEETVIKPAIDKLGETFDNYSSSFNKYTVKFVVNGVVVKTDSVISGDAAIAPAGTPEKAYDDNYHYTFNKWDKEFTNITEDLTVTAIFNEIHHSWNEGEITTPSTCTTAGVMTFTCKLDGSHTKTEDVAINAEAHSWNEGVITTAATCSKEGVKTFTCKHDGNHTKTESVAIDANAHEWNEGEITTAATCTTAGVKTFTCKLDGTHTKTEAVAIDANAHDFGEWTTTTAATCTAEGEQRRDCSRCDAFETKVIEKTAHTPVPGEYKAPTCISEGYEGATICDVCKVEITAGKPIDKLAHEFGNTPVQVIPENCTYEATYVYKCKFCTETNKVGGEAKPEGDKGPHTIVELEKIEPTCDTAGIYSYYCSTCGGAVKTETIDPIGHADKDGDGYCDNCGGKYFDPNNQSVCTCLCHKESGFMKFLYKIANFFWKLFKINKSCACGYVHY